MTFICETAAPLVLRASPYTRVARVRCVRAARAERPFHIPFHGPFVRRAPRPARARPPPLWVRRAPSSNEEEGGEEEGSGPSSSSEDEGAFVRRRRGGGKRMRAGKGLHRPAKCVVHVHAYMRGRCLSRLFLSTVRAC